ncbi:MAG: hypothetical protein ACOYLS_08680 [Polymorphobacter sp.]
MRNYAGSALMLLVTIAAAVGSYTVNLRVSGERAAVERLRNQIVADARSMRNLQAELRTRARFPEMQRWNDSVLQMSAPASGQFLQSAVQLASYAAAPAAPAVEPALRYAVTTPVPQVMPSDRPVQAAWQPPAEAATLDTARVIRASYVGPQRRGYQPAAAPEAPARTAAPAARSIATVPAARSIATVPAARSIATAPTRMAAPSASPLPAEPAAPTDLLPEGGQ